MKSPLIPLLGLTLCASGATVAYAAPSPQPTSSPALSRYQPAQKHDLQLSVPAGETVVEVKFAHGLPVDADNGRVRAERATQDRSPALELLRRADVVATRPLFAQPEGQLKRLKVEAEKASGVEQSDLTQWVAVTAKDHAAAKRLASELNASADVEVAYVRPKSTSIREGQPRQEAAIAASEDLTRFQGYLGEPSTSYGINAFYAHGIDGGAGKGITIGDTEVGWVYDHEDLSKLTQKSVVTNGTPSEEDTHGTDHGTSVAGEMIGDKNGKGVTGIAYDANMIVSHAVTKERKFDPANGVGALIPHLKKGDVLVVELHTPGCSGGGGRGGLVAEEWIPSVYDAIKTATSKGIHVVEAAGNGGENLDSSCYGKRFPNDRDDSGAIIVGAGAGKDSTGRNRYCGAIGDRQIFSTYGSRVNSFAWGLCVTTTTGRGYTNGFSGTSSATPIVAGAVASLSGIAKARGIELTPVQMRELVASTGTPANYGAGIGTMPDLKKAIAKLDGMGSQPKPTASATPTSTPTATSTPTVQPTVTTSPTPTVTPTATSMPTPVPGPFDCAKLKKQEVGSVAAGKETVVSSGGFLFSRGGKHRFCLSPSRGLDADLRIEAWGIGGWKQVASTSGANDQLEFDGGIGFYRIVVVSRNNTGGSFQLSYELA